MASKKSFTSELQSGIQQDIATLAAQLERDYPQNRLETAVLPDDGNTPRLFEGLGAPRHLRPT